VRKFERFVGVALVSLAVLGALVVALAARATIQHPLPDSQSSTAMFFGFWKLLYNTAVPPVNVIIAAAGLGLVLAAVVALVERRVGTRARIN
jgi:biofilm PGA synthesis N-glycosyltransferase PgaC